MRNYIKYLEKKLHDAKCDQDRMTELQDEFNWNEVTDEETFILEITRVLGADDIDPASDFGQEFIDAIRFERAIEIAKKAKADGCDNLNASMYGVSYAGLIADENEITEHDDRWFTAVENQLN